MGWRSAPSGRAERGALARSALVGVATTVTYTSGVAPIRRPRTDAGACRIAKGELQCFQGFCLACDVLLPKPMDVTKLRAELTARYLERAAHFFALAAEEVTACGNPFSCPSIAHAMASALDAQAAAVGARDHIDPKTIKTKEI